MGRYVTGAGFQYKFAVGDQSSSFGEVIERLAEDTDNSVTRYTSDYGEIVRVWVNDAEALIQNIKEFAQYDELTPEQVEKWRRGELKLGDDYWNKVMMKRFLEEVNLTDDSGTLEFEVEY